MFLLGMYFISNNHLLVAITHNKMCFRVNYTKYTCRTSTVPI